KSKNTKYKNTENVMLTENLKVSDQVLRPMMEQYPLFFESKDRKRRLSKILPKDTDEYHFELSMMAVLVKASVPDIRIIARQLLLNGLQMEENDLLKQLERNYSLERTLELIGRHFGVLLDRDNEPLLQLFNVLVYQH